MDSIKQTAPDRELTLTRHPELRVGDCVPFYFCPRSVMLYLIDRVNHPELTYRGGQTPIIHFEADLHSVVAWADPQDRRWAFTLSDHHRRPNAFFVERGLFTLTAAYDAIGPSRPSLDHSTPTYYVFCV